MSEKQDGVELTLGKELLLDLRTAEAGATIARALHNMYVMCAHEGIHDDFIRARIEILMDRAFGAPFVVTGEPGMEGHKESFLEFIMRTTHSTALQPVEDPQVIDDTCDDCDERHDPAEPCATEAEPKASAPELEPSKTAAEGTPHYVTGPWSEDEEGTALEMDARGASLGEIACALNRDPKSMNLKMRHLRKRAAAEAEDDQEESLAAAQPDPEAVGPKLDDADKRDPIVEVSKTRKGFSFRAATSAPMKVHHEHDRLNKLGYRDGWDPERDVVLARTLVAGDGLSAAAIRLAQDAGTPTREEMIARWDELCPKKTIAAQALLLPVLEARSEAFASAQSA